MKICELKIKDIASVNSITQALLLNGYLAKSCTKFKEFPRETSIDYFAIEIYDHPKQKKGVLMAIKELNNEPAADVVEVVRCENCKHWGGITFGNICRRWTGLNEKNCTKPTDFCSYGEKRSEDKR